ncbi:tripartite tricarboxylate transporter substrate binding protein [Xylophilus sp. GOD-11R]|uniref:Bug family tripartite tricarboxylate transporter substrate binding protein n=1 Tax=Xylophilus sp. GOD-11R TaxID=3089814 RepID=UPI00298BD2E4|nr:tripartite tricarboxylate transporter substrate binding protein [Xylophilus sp. GOD-11R]WPB58928.1 tripartite tricarboxylate transporter substrate binding protein [Xylophilus sp. GOD-11R]
MAILSRLRSSVFRAVPTLCAAAVLSLTGIAASAQGAYPSKPIKLVIPFGAGGITDVVGRLIGQQLGEELKQSVIIDNRAGAGGSIAAQAVSQAAPDGYTLLLATVGTQVVNKMIYSKLAYDPAAFAPVSLVSNSPYVMAVSDIPGVNDLQGLVTYARSHPGQLNFGSAGNGSSPHLGIELFKLSTKTFIVHIPFKSGAEAVNAALGGQVQIVIDAIPVIQPQVKAGRLKALAIADSRRNAAVPELRTSVEQGVPGFQIGSWNAIVAPQGTPAATVEVLSQALTRVLSRPKVVASLAELGIEPLPTGVAAYNAHVRAETEKWTRVTQAAGTKLD